MLVSAFPQIRLGVIHRLEIYLDCLKAVSKEIVSRRLFVVIRPTAFV